MPGGGHNANTGAAGTGLADTDGLVEGSSNLYFTNARVDTRHQTINTQGTYANRPAAGAANTGYFYYATDIGVMFCSTGSAWTVIADPWGFDFFSTLGYLPADVEMSSLPAWVQPTPESTILVSGGSINVTGNLLDCIWGATSGIQVAAWDFAAVKSKVLVVCPQLGAGKTQAIPGVFCQNAALSGTEMDNGYVSLMSSTGLHHYKESTGFTELDPEDEIAPSGVAGTAHNPFFGMALY